MKTPLMDRPNAQRILRNWTHLCEHIGDRRAGSAGDRAAADYILGQFQRAGLQNVHAEPFPCVTVRKAKGDIFLGCGRTLKAVPARVLSGSGGTPGGRAIESELVWVEMPEQADRLFTPSLRGKIVVLFGPMPTQATLHQRLVKCQPAAVIHVDDRLPFAWVKDDGVYPVWVKQYGMPPTVTIPYQTAWALKKQGANRARVRIKVELEETQSANLVAEIPGRRPELPVVLLGAHHDTQCNNAGADDNASGVVVLLELAALLHGCRPLRTVRLVSFGAEEQLSVGAAQYAHAHRKEMSGIGVVLNLDSVSSPLGHHNVLRAGTKAFGSWLLQSLSEAGLEAREKDAPMPFADHFPFSAFGIPAATFLRSNMDSGMRWQHHSAQDNLDNVSVAELARVVKALAKVTRTLTGRAQWPFGHGLAPEQRAETARMARELFSL